MTTISIPTGIRGTAGNISSTICVGSAFSPTSRVPEWLPVPASPARLAANGRTSRAASRRTGIWIRPEGIPLTEKLMLSLLTVAAAAGIGYGFSCLLDLVQHWAVFGAGISRLVQ